MRKLDSDVKRMTPAELRQEVMRLRTAFRNELADRGNRRCWITLLAQLPEGKALEPLRLGKKEFIRNCERYYDRNR